MVENKEKTTNILGITIKEDLVKIKDLDFNKINKVQLFHYSFSDYEYRTDYNVGAVFIVDYDYYTPSIGLLLSASHALDIPLVRSRGGFNTSSDKTTNISLSDSFDTIDYEEYADKGIGTYIVVSYNKGTGTYTILSKPNSDDDDNKDTKTILAHFVRNAKKEKVEREKQERLAKARRVINSLTKEELLLMVMEKDAKSGK